MRPLIDPGLILHHHAPVTEFAHHRARRWLVDDSGHASEFLDAYLLRMAQIFINTDADIELQASFRISRVVERDAAEHQSIRQPQMVALERHEDGRTRVERDDDAFVSVDDHVSRGANGCRRLISTPAR